MMKTTTRVTSGEEISIINNNNKKKKKETPATTCDAYINTDSVRYETRSSHRGILPVESYVSIWIVHYIIETITTTRLQQQLIEEVEGV